jgi:hypothetical protein
MDRGVASAFMSPINGKRILITLPCNTFCIYDTQSDGTPFRSWEVQPKGLIHSKPSNYPLKVKRFSLCCTVILLYMVVVVCIS